MNTKQIALIATIGLSAAITPAAKANSITHDFKQGEVMCLVSSINQENNKEIKMAYFQGVRPVAGNLGFEWITNLYVDTQLAGDHQAPAFSLIKIPSTQAKIDLNDKYLSDWANFRKMRPDVWKNIVQREYELDKDLTIKLDDQKYYQVETFWVQQDRELEFDQYRINIEAKVPDYSGRVLYKAGMPSSFETLGKERAPSHMVITEWENKKQFEKFSKQDMAKPFKYLGGYNAWLMKPRIQS